MLGCTLRSGSQTPPFSARHSHDREITHRLLGRLQRILALLPKNLYIGRDFPEIVVFSTSRATGADEQKDYI